MASLAFDPSDGRPAIAYSKSSDLYFAWYDGASWQTQLVDEDVSVVGPGLTLAFNDYGTGFPSIAYYGYDPATSEYSLYFIDDPAGVPEPTTLMLVLGGAWLLRRGWRRG